MQSVIFKDRIDAANELVKRLRWLKEDEEVQLEDKVQKNKSAAVVMAIPRGGIIIGDLVASELGAKLDVVVSRKIGAPSIPSLQWEL
jgi:putative phosphoribosyl transferase